MRDDVLAAQPTDWRDVVRTLLGPAPGGRAIFYQKHMTHHMLPEIGRDWIAACRNAFLIRRPEDVLASYKEKRTQVTLADLGFVQQRELFERECDRLGHAPPVVDSRQVLVDPRGTLMALCRALGIPFTETMLSWPAGGRPSDGVWAPAWYDAVIRSTGFAAPHDREPSDLDSAQAAIAEQAQVHYDRLRAFALT
jgi:hypothetical protein